MTDFYLQTITRKIISTGFFEYAPGSGIARRIEFAENGKCGIGADDEFDSWFVSYNERKRKVQLSLFSKEVLAVLLFLEDSGVWKGRDRNSRGVSLIRPFDKDLPEWRMLANPGSFTKSFYPDDEEPDFKYKEPLAPKVDYSKAKTDIRNSMDYSVLKDSSTAICIVGCDRISYFQRTAKSIATNPETAVFPVFVFLDKPADSAREYLQEEHAKIARSLFKECIIVKREMNLGCGRNLIDVRRQLFDNLGYKRVFIFEDDMVVSSSYIRLTMELFNWAERNFTNVGAVQCWNKCDYSKSIKKLYLNAVQNTFSNWWGYCMSDRAWIAIRDQMYKYEDLFLQSEYRFRPHESIKDWFRKKLSSPRISLGSRPFRSLKSVEDHRKRYFDTPPTGQDAATMHLFWKAGFERLCTVVNRGEYIGKHGMHMTSVRFEQMGFGRVKLEDFEEDKTLSDFVIFKKVHKDGGTSGVDGLISIDA